MSARTLTLFFASSLCIAGCASDQEDYSSTPEAATALANCRAASNAPPATTGAAPNAFAAAAKEIQYIDDCMAAAGYGAGAKTEPNAMPVPDGQ